MAGALCNWQSSSHRYLIKKNIHEHVVAATVTSEQLKRTWAWSSPLIVNVLNEQGDGAHKKCERVGWPAFSGADFGGETQRVDNGADALWAFVAFDVDLAGSTIHRNRCLVIQ